MEATMLYKQTSVPPQSNYAKEHSNLTIQYHDILNLIIVKGKADDNWPYSFKKIKALIRGHFLSHDNLNVLFRISKLDEKSKRGLMKVIERMNENHAEGKLIKVVWSTKADSHLNKIGLAMGRICDFPLVITSI